ncbi:MAG: RNA polymerase sigma factor [Planctomycetota bacterium]
MTQSDAELVQEVLDGNNEVYALLVARYERSVRAVAISIVKSSHTADDIAQEAFVRSWQQLRTLRAPKVFGPWLIKITRRCAIDSLRRQQSLKYSDALDQLAAHERNGQLDEKKQHLLETIQQLPKAERQVVMLRYFGPHSVRDLANIVGRSVGTVTKQLSRAHKRLKNRLQETEK